jgi:hypothetical protein
MIKSRRMRWAGHEARMGERRNAYRILVGKSERKRPLLRQDVDGWTILEWILREIEWVGLDWDQWRTLMNTIMNLRVP